MAGGDLEGGDLKQPLEQTAKTDAVDHKLSAEGNERNAVKDSTIPRDKVAALPSTAEDVLGVKNQAELHYLVNNWQHEGKNVLREVHTAAQSAGLSADKSQELVDAVRDNMTEQQTRIALEQCVQNVAQGLQSLCRQIPGMQSVKMDFTVPPNATPDQYTNLLNRLAGQIDNAKDKMP